MLGVLVGAFWWISFFITVVPVLLIFDMACTNTQPAFQGPFTSIHPVATDDDPSADDSADEGGRRYYVTVTNASDYVLQVHRYFIGAACN